DSAPIPELQPEYLLVKVSHVALNPSDWRMSAGSNSNTPHTVGCDMSGRVVQVGTAVTKPFAPGDRIAGLVYGQRIGHPDSGAFADYCLVKEGLALHIPDSVSDAEAATLGVGITTIGQGIPPPPTLLIYGGSTATGLFALQFARLSGWRTVTTCSPRNAAKCAALGASAVFDYADAMYTGLVPFGEFPRGNVRAGWRAGYTAFGEAHAFPGMGVSETVAEDYMFAGRMWGVVEGCWRRG
ncbi:chaperonin 10-like protein, partial [Macrophomina phaseolina]